MVKELSTGTKDYLVKLNIKLYSVATNHQTSLDELRNRGYMANYLPIPYFLLSCNKKI